MNEGIDAVNYCRTRDLYAKSIADSQHRANINNTVELVLWIDNDDHILDETICRPQPVAEITRQKWR